MNEGNRYLASLFGQPVPAHPMTSLQEASPSMMEGARGKWKDQPCEEWTEGFRALRAGAISALVIGFSDLFLEAELGKWLGPKSQEAAPACSPGVPSLPAHPKCLFIQVANESCQTKSHLKSTCCKRPILWHFPFINYAMD